MRRRPRPSRSRATRTVPTGRQSCPRGNPHRARGHFGDAAIRAAILLAVVIPAYFNPQTQHSFEPDKAALLRSVVLLALAVWLILAIDRYADRVESPPPDATAGQRLMSFLSSPLVAPVLVLATAYLVATAGSVLPRLSLNGAYSRAQGLYTIAAYVALFFLVRRTRWASCDIDLLTGTILLVSVPIAIYAILQHWGLDPLTFTTEGTPVADRPISTLGNPIFLAAYLIMVMPLSGWRFYRSWAARVDQRNADLVRQAPSRGRDYSSLAAWGLLLVLQVSAFIVAESRGPLLGLFAALACGALIWIARGRLPSRVYTAAPRARRLLMVVMVLVVVVVVAALTQLLPKGVAATRLGRTADLSSRTARERILIWQAATDLMTSNPARSAAGNDLNRPTAGSNDLSRLRLWLGYGPSTFRETVTPYLPPEMAQLKPNLDFDRAHNAVFDAWVSAGVLGVAAYLLIVAATLYYGLRLTGFGGDVLDSSGGDEPRPWLLPALMLVGTLLGGLVAWLWFGLHWIGVGLPLGLLGGMGLFLTVAALRTHSTPRRGEPVEPPRGERDPVTGTPPLRSTPPLAIPLLLGIVAHTVETVSGIATVATSILFWLYAGLIASQATAGGNRSAADGASSPGSSWAIVTGVTVALVGLPLLSSGPPSGLLIAGAVVSITATFGIWLLAVEHRAANTFTLQYLGIAAATVAGLALLVVLPPRLPWRLTDLSHATVAVFVFVLVAVPALAVVLVRDDGGDTSALRRVPPIQGGLGRQMVYGLVLAGGLGAIWIASITPIRADVFYKAGLSRAMRGDISGARTALETSVALEPDQDVYQSQLGVTFAQLAQAAPADSESAAQRQVWLVEAEDHLQQAQRLDPYRADHLRNLGVLHYRLLANAGASKSESEQAREEHVRHALDYYAQAAARNPVGVRTQRDWGQAHATLGHWNEAIDHYETSLRLNAQFPETWILLGEAKLQIGDYAGAKVAYQQALSLDPQYVRETYETSAAGSPDDPLPHKILAIIYAASGDTREALAEANTARRLTAGQPANWEAFLATLR